MQAPATPSGPPVQEPDERRCPTCGAASGLTAAFCWQCYRPFGASAPSPPATGAPPNQGVWSPTPNADDPNARQVLWPQSPGPFDVRAKRPGGLGRMTSVILLTLAVIGGAYWFVNRGPGVSFPGSFGGLQLMENAQTRLVIDSFHSQLDTLGVEGDLAMYGDGTPTAAVMWIRDASVPTTSAAFDEFASGFDSGIGNDGSLDRSRRSEATVGGVTYICAPVVGVASGSICMWQDQDLFWLLLDFSGLRLEAGQDLAVVAHDAIEAA